MAERPYNVRRFIKVAERVCDLFSELELSALDGELAAIFVAAQSAAARVYHAEREGVGLKHGEILEMYGRVYREFYRMTYDELMLNGEPGQEEIDRAR